ncbi:MAG: hypothetical protein IJS54_07470 [Desulfovibrio sp.]|nr:hypothetical protein [Desulfovibrio sp.]
MFDDIIEEIGKAYEQYLPKPIIKEDFLDLIDNIKPQIPDQDRATAKQEIEALLDRDRTRDSSPLMRYFLPLFLHEANFNHEDLDPNLLQGYSYTFVNKALSGEYHVPDEFIAITKRIIEPVKKPAFRLEEEQKEQEKQKEQEEQATESEKDTETMTAADIKRKKLEEKHKRNLEKAQEKAEKKRAKKEAKKAKRAKKEENTPSEEAESSLEADVVQQEPVATPPQPKEAEEVVRPHAPEPLPEVSVPQPPKEAPAPHPEPVVDQEPKQHIEAEDENLGILERKLRAVQTKQTAPDIPDLPPPTLAQKKTEPTTQTVTEGELLACYQNQVLTNDTCALYWLAKASNDHLPCPLWLTHLLHLGVHLLPGMQLHALDTLTLKALHTIDELNERQCLLLACALLRPALMAPDSNIGTLIASLATRLSEYACTHFFRRLNRFITQGSAIDAVLFVGKTTEKERLLHFERLKDNTQSFMNRIQNGRMPIAAALRVRNDLFAPTGVLGHALNQCLNQEFQGLPALLKSLETGFDRERLIDTNRMYPKQKKISEYPRKKLLELITEAYDLLKEWEDYARKARDGEESSYMRETLTELFSGIEIDTQKLNKLPEGRLFTEQLALLAQCPATPLPKEPCDAQTQLDLWPLRFPLYQIDPASDLPLASFVDFLMTGTNTREAIAASVATHMMHGKLEACQRYLKIAPDLATIPLDPQLFTGAFAKLTAPNLEQLFSVCVEHFTHAFASTLDRVRSLISDYSFRSVIHFAQQSQYNNRLETIENTYHDGMAKAFGVWELTKIEKELYGLEEEKRKEVQGRISELLSQKTLSQEARERLEGLAMEHLRLGMFNSCWADIVEVEEHLISGKPLRPIASQDSGEANAAHDFYSQLEANTLPGGILVPLWEDAKRRLRNKPLASEKGRNADARDVGLVTELLRWLGFILDQSEQAKAVHSDGRPNFWRIIQYTMEIAGPLPQWGSRQNRHVIVFGWDVRPEDINQLFSGSRFATEDAVTVLCFTPLDWPARKKVLSFCASRHIAPLIIDTNLVNFLANQDGSMRTEVLFRVALAGASINPYMPDIAGSVPKEMFFGREEDIRAVMSAEGPCILYGGRQLGKSALLQQIYKRPNPGVRVLLHSMKPTETSLLEAALFECRKAELVPDTTTLSTFAEAVSAWLTNNPDMRILLLLDECDRALEADAKQEFADAAQFRNLMQETERRFKVVFTGLHSVQRFSQIPNNPLYHFGEPLCIGPLTPDAANDLMRKPTQILGLSFANDQLVQLALNLCSYQPKLIQIFCSELVRALDNRPNRMPFHTIDKETILQIYDSHNLKKKILEGFEMTLNLDERYLVIGYTMAINRGKGFSLQELLEELADFWPQAFGEESADKDLPNTLRCLLHEMEGLGLVISLGGQYRLRTPNVIELLGGEDAIYTRLDPYQTKPYHPQDNPDEMRIPGLLPLVASQYAQLSEKTNTLTWISGSKALGLDLLPKALERIAEEGGLTLIKLHGTTVPQVMETMRQTVEKQGQGVLFCLDAEEFPPLGLFLEQADVWLTNLRSTGKGIKIVCIVDPQSLFGLVRTKHNEQYSSYQMELLPWTSEGIGVWCKNRGIPGIDAEQTMAKTGGWMPCVMACLTKGDLPGAIKSLEKPNACLPTNSSIRTFVKKLAQELGSEHFSYDDILNWASELPECGDESLRRDTLNTLISLKILRTRSSMYWLEPLLAQFYGGVAPS